MNSITDIINFIYAYCTDFILSIANMTGFSYYEINFYIFCIAYPAFCVFAVIFYVYNLRKYKTKLK